MEIKPERACVNQRRVLGQTHDNAAHYHYWLHYPVTFVVARGARCLSPESLLPPPATGMRQPAPRTTEEDEA